MEIYKDLSNPASKEFEQLLNSQFTKTANLEEGKIITGVVNKVTDNFVFLEVPGLKSEPILDINELKSMGMLDKAKVGDLIKGAEVKGYSSFGCFFSVNGELDVLVHLQEMSYSRVNHPDEVFTIGEKHDLKVISVDLEKLQVGCSV